MLTCVECEKPRMSLEYYYCWIREKLGWPHKSEAERTKQVLWLGHHPDTIEPPINGICTHCADKELSQARGAE